MTTVLSPLLLVVLALVPPLTEAQLDPPPCTTNTCPPGRPICLFIDDYNRCFCPENTYGDNCENTCGGNLTATDAENFLTSPNFPANYPTYLLCTWNIQAPSGLEVVLTFNSFNVEETSNCLYDVVRINGVNNYCGSSIPPATSGSSITIFFRSEYLYTFSGFNATYRVIIDECQSSPCQNGATCQDGVNSFTCDCAPGFSGTLCEVNIDECQSSPCQNGATCQDGVNSFTCDCAPGFSGTLCEAATYTLTYCIARGGRGLALGAPPAVTLTLTGSAGSTGTVTLTRSSDNDLCSSTTFTSTSIGAIQEAVVTPTSNHGNQKTTLWKLVVSGAGQNCSFPDTEWLQGEETRTLAASC